MGSPGFPNGESRGAGEETASSPTAYNNCHHVDGLQTENQHSDGNQIKILQNDRKGSLTRGVSIRKRRRTYWTYNGNFEFWWKGTEGWSAIEFKLTDEIKKKFEGSLLVKHSEVDDAHLLDILQDITHMESSRSSDANSCQFCFMSKFLDDIQTVDNPASVRREELGADCNGSKVPGHLISSLRYFGPLKVLDLSRRPFKSNHLALARAMESGNLRSLENLLLNKTGLTDADCVLYAKALESGKVEALSQIYLSYNEIGDSGVAALGHAFQSGHVKSLQVIDLSVNRIEDDGVVALASAFKSGQVKHLRTISLSVNMIGDDGMVELAASLEFGQFTDLRNLYLGYNKFGVKGINRLARALESGNLNSLSLLHLKLPEKASLNEHYNAKSLLQAFYRNPYLTVDIDSNAEFDGCRVQSQLNRLRERNLKRVELLLAAGGRAVSATFGKVYLCGNPEVGKTTLRRSLQRTQIESLYTWERREHVEPRTRGIHICQITSKAQPGKSPVSLTLWDMAGQNDYHLVHNAFLPDSAYSEGKATIFVVMCSSHSDVNKAQRELENWFKFIASSVNQSFSNQRDVFVVVNRMHGDSAVMEKTVLNEWRRMLSSQSKKFDNCLKIKPDPFVIDVRVREYVQNFKQSLIELSREMLEKVKVPEICHIVQGYLSDWVQTRKQFPVLPWVEVQAELHKRGADWPEETLESAIKYLNEAGVLVYIDKKFPQDWSIREEKLVVADPNWLCKEILGNMFLPERMGVSTSSLFRDKVNPNTGSIRISEFKKYFGSLEGTAWDNTQLDHLLTILLWLGFCFKGRKDNIFIPALIYEEDAARKLKGFWNEGDSHEHREGQWIMGFLVEHVTSQTALAPMALWHRFEVEVAQIPRFNGERVDTDFVAGKHFITFKVEYMVVLIEVNANDSQSLAFDRIEVLVKPLRNQQRDQLDVNTRKQRQVDLAGDIVKILVDLWDEVCPGMGYLLKIVWPWPVSFPRAPSRSERNLEVAKLKNEVELHGGREMQWTVGEHDIVTEDQLLSTKSKEGMKIFIERGMHGGKENIQKADGLKEVGPSKALGHRSKEETSQVPHTKHCQEVKLDNACSSQSCSHNHLAISLEEVLKNTRAIKESQREMRESHSEMNKNLTTHYSQFFQKVDDFERTFLEDKENVCPKIMYVGEKNSSWWRRLKDLEASPIVNVHVHFQCEANYKDGGPHAVSNQEGIDVSHLEDWARKLAPWIKYSVKFLLGAAKIDTNSVAPGLGMVIPNFTEWPHATLIADGFSEFTGFTEKELDDLIISDMRPAKAGTPLAPEELYGESRKAMAEILGKLSVQEYKEKLGLQKVRLRSMDGSLIGVRWICNECYSKYRAANLLTAL